jgi:hypothetical protein
VATIGEDRMQMELTFGLQIFIADSDLQAYLPIGRCQWPRPGQVTQLRPT